MRGPKANREKVIIKIFDEKEGSEKRPHTCPTCFAYKRAMEKGDKDAFNFYKDHLSEIARKNHGVTVVLYGKPKQLMLGSGFPKKGN